MSATALVDWGALGQVVLYGLLAGVGLPAVYALTVLGAGRVNDARRTGRTAAATGYLLMSVAGAAVCAAAIVYGIWLMARK